MKDIVKRILDSGYMGVVAITGGGTAAINELLCHGGGSSTILEAIVPYSIESLSDFIGEYPGKCASIEVARKMANLAYCRAQELSAGQKRFGVAATCTLKRADAERANREHWAHFAYQNEDSNKTVSLKFAFNTREEEEEFVTSKFIAFIAEACKISDGQFPDSTSLSTPAALTELFIKKGPKKYYPFDMTGYAKPKLVFPGSFNPLHEGHLKIAEYSSKLTGYITYFEISVFNAGGKTPLDMWEIEKRAGQFGGKGILDLVITNAAMFHQKAELFPQATFIVGSDTWNRIVNESYYSNSAKILTACLDKFLSNKVKFLVFNRLLDGKVIEASKSIPDHDFFANKENIIFVDKGHQMIDISSTKIREQLV